MSLQFFLRFVLCSCLLADAARAFAIVETGFIIFDTHKNQESQTPLTILPDLENRFTPEQALQELLRSSHQESVKSREFPIEVKTVWLLADVTNHSTARDFVVLEAWMSNAFGWQVDAGRLVELTPIAYRYPILRLTLETGRPAKILLKISQDLGPIRLELSMISLDSFVKEAFSEQFMHASTIYVVAALGCIGLLLSGFFREKFYFYNAIYILSFDGFLLGMLGVMKFPSYWLLIGLIPLSGLSLGLFNLHFFSSIRSTRIAVLQTCILVAMFVFYALSYFSADFLPFCYLMASVMILVSIYLAFRDARAGDQSATLMLMGWSMLALSTSVGMFHVFIHSSDTTTLLCLGAFLGEAVFFNISMAIKIRNKERRVSKLNKHTLEQLGKVFYPHQIELMRGGKQLESTMPVGKGQACVLCFDIINSTAIKHPMVYQFFQNVIKHCQESMLLGYDGNTMRASAYRIKEMGDGFLCSIGFPFQATEANLADAAVNMALRFHRIFVAEVALLGYTQPIACSMAIAFGDIASYFPQSGTREYDVQGVAVVLATRYEQFRKVLFPQCSNSVLILDQRTCELLSDTQRSLFTVIDIKSRGLVIRDDGEATAVAVLNLTDEQVPLPKVA